MVLFCFGFDDAVQSHDLGLYQLEFLLVLVHFYLVIFVLCQLLLNFPDLDHQLLVLGGFGGDHLSHLTNLPLHPLNLLFQTLNLLQSLLVVIGKLGISR